MINALRLDTLTLRKKAGNEKELMDEKSIHLKMLTNLEVTIEQLKGENNLLQKSSSN